MSASADGTATAPTDTAHWTSLTERWNARMTAFFPGRDESIRVMFDLVSDLVAREPARVLDLGCGPGPLAARLLERFPTTQIVALDIDPVLLRIGERALGDGAGRLRWVQANLRELDWTDTLAGLGPFDAVLSLATLHHLPARDVRRVYGDLARLTRPGGLFLNTEGMTPGPAGSRLTQALREARTRERPEDDTWWEDVKADPALASLVAERARLFALQPSGRVRHVTAERHCRDLRAAGFAEAVIAWRRHDETTVAALR